MSKLSSSRVYGTLDVDDEITTNGKSVATTDLATTSANGLMSNTDKTKLDGVAPGANNYTHPATHPASIITEDVNNRFVTDAEKTSWNAKASTAVATTSANGLMSNMDKIKLNAVATNIEDGVGVGSTQTKSSSGGIGNYSFAEGLSSASTGEASHAEGVNTLASGFSSHSEGEETTASGWASHAEGSSSIASDIASHAEGLNTRAISVASHAEGWGTHAIGVVSHAEGWGTHAIGNYSHTEGQTCLAGDIAPYNIGIIIHSIDTIANSIKFMEPIDIAIVNGDYVCLTSPTSMYPLRIENIGSGRDTIFFNSADTIFSIDALTECLDATFYHKNSGFNHFFAAHAEGTSCVATGQNAHAEGFYSNAIGRSSHAEGHISDAEGFASHAEGSSNAIGEYSHAEGCATKTIGKASHAEGHVTQAIGTYSHAEGYYARAIANYSHAEGDYTTASGIASHAEGYDTTASGIASHAEGYYTTASGDYSHAQGYYTTASGDYSHAQGYYTTASGESSHAEGTFTLSTGGLSYKITAFNNTAKTITLDNVNTLAVGNKMHIKRQGFSSILNVPVIAINGLTVTLNTTVVITADWKYAIRVLSTCNSHAEGSDTLASGYSSHAEGCYTTASGDYSHAQGRSTIASGYSSHAEGNITTASGYSSHAQGIVTIASGYSSHAEGYYTTAETYALHAMGRYNKVNAGSETVYSATQNALVIGNGTSVSALSNAFRVTFDGKTYGLSAFNSTGADYAEYFEWLDGNPKNEDRIGRFVTLDGDKIRLANESDTFILGVISGNQSIIGNAHEDSWNDMYLRDDFGRLLYEDVEVEKETGKDENDLPIYETIIEKHIKLNPAYDSTLEYTPRSQRKEWGIVGMLGQVIVRDDGTCKPNGYCKSLENGVATASETGYRILKRINEHLIIILLK